MTTSRKVALVSGGSRGIGRAVVLKLAADGFDVGFCYRGDEKAAGRVAEEARAFGGRALPVRADVSRGEEMRAWVARAEEVLGPVEVVVTSAGITRDGPLVLTDESDWDAVVGTNLSGVFHLCRAAVFGMMKRRSGCVVTMSSVSGIYGNAAQTGYAATKAGIIGFTKALAKEVGGRGVRVNAVAPGLIDTEMITDMDAEVKRRVLAQMALGRLGRPEEVAELVAFLASDRAGYITGSVLEIHGGIIA